MLHWILWAVVSYGASGFASFVLRRRPRLAGAIGAAGCLLAAVFGLHAATTCLLSETIERTRLAWNVPYASFAVALGYGASLFLLPVFSVGSLVAIAALRRLPGDYAANHPHEHWLFLNLTLAGATLVCIAANGVLFLFGWELMTVASFLLVENDQRKPGGRSGGWVYLTAGHLGCAALFAMFALAGAGHGTLDFSNLVVDADAASIIFLLACAGFGGKIGLAPLQTWYPEAYAAVPAHVGAVLSGVVGNMGVYGFIMVITLLGGATPPPAWWGYLLIAMGLGSAVIGAARALSSRDLFRLLAWSSVENYGFMAAGLGLGLLGAATGNGVVSFLGFAAAIIHMLNHALSKALLFLSAGSLAARTGTRDLDRMGGLMKRLPLTGLLFLVGGMGAAAVPPLNGFVGEFLLLLSAFDGVRDFHPASLPAAASFLVLAAVAVAGGLAVAAYLKAFGFAFLGNARGAGAASSAPEAKGPLLPHAVLAALAVGMAALSPWALDIVRKPASRLAGLWGPQGDLDMWLQVTGPQAFFSTLTGAWLLAGCVAAVFLLRRLLLRGKKSASVPTWDCGYAAPDARMQYTASSFVRPVEETFAAAVNPIDAKTPPQGYFPAHASFASDIPPVEKALVFSHLFRAAQWLAAKVRIMQAGRVQVYLLYMAAALVILLLWKL